jgi:putative flippase GtrA
LSGGLGAGQASRSAAELYQRFRQLIHEGAKFLTVGGIGFVVVLAGSDALHFELGLGKFTSVTIATVLATVITFLGNRYWSFKDRQGAGARSETVLFFLLNGVGLLIQYACIFLVTDVIALSGRIWYTFANFVGVGIGTLFRFWSYRKWIWVHPEVHLARLRRGRHRKGRVTPAPHRPAPHPPAAYQAAVYQPVPYPPTQPQPVPLAKRPVRTPGPPGGSNPLTQPMVTATHTQAPPAEEPDRWIS